MTKVEAVGVLLAVLGAVALVAAGYLVHPALSLLVAGVLLLSAGVVLVRLSALRGGNR